MATAQVVSPKTSCCPQCGLTDHSKAVDRSAVEAQAALLSVIADPVRLGIIELLLRHDRLCVCDLAGAFPVGQPTISHHLRLLREADLVDVIRRGHWAYYGLRREALKRLVQDLVRLL